MAKVAEGKFGIYSDSKVEVLKALKNNAVILMDQLINAKKMSPANYVLLSKDIKDSLDRIELEEAEEAATVILPTIRRAVSGRAALSAV